MAEPRFGFHSYSTRSSEQMILHGNRLLTRGDTEEAISTYSDVLFQICPGNVCAFLNRSMAYMWIGHYELAATDAYRAAVSTNAMRDRDDKEVYNRMWDVQKYLDVEKVCVDAKEEWTSKEKRFLGRGWWESPMASIVIDDLPETNELALQCRNRNLRKRITSRFTKGERQKHCDALEIRAMYRLCGALYHIGGGARAEALGIIDDVDPRYNLEPWEKLYFFQLGTEIMLDVAREAKDGIRYIQSFEDQQCTSQNDDGQHETRVKADMKTKTTEWKKLDVYLWDAWEPELHHREWKEILKVWIKGCTDSCELDVVATNCMTDDTQNPYVQLRANRDIFAGEPVLFEKTSANVTTSNPRDSFKKRHSNSKKHYRYYCDSCAALLLLPDRHRIHFESGEVSDGNSDTFSPKSSRSPSTSLPSTASLGRLESPELDVDMSSDHAEYGTSPKSATSSSRPPTPPPHRESTAPTSPPPREQYVQRTHADFMFCCPKHIVPTCSDDCRRARENFDNGLCGTSVENDLRRDHLRNTTHSDTDYRVDSLHDLLLMRTLTMALNTNKHPLHIQHIVFATAGIDLNNHKAYKTQPWSFQANIVRPIAHINELITRSETDPFTQLEKTDGWIINTLLSKIRIGTRISKGPRYVKTYDENGILASAIDRTNDRWNTTISALGREKEDVWIGSINPIFNMIRVADPTLGEEANVRIVQKEGIQCFAIAEEEGKVAIRKGEVILRAEDGEGWYKSGDEDEIEEEIEIEETYEPSE